MTKYKYPVSISFIFRVLSSHLVLSQKTNFELLVEPSIEPSIEQSKDIKLDINTQYESIVGSNQHTHPKRNSSLYAAFKHCYGLFHQRLRLTPPALNFVSQLNNHFKGCV